MRYRWNARSHDAMRHPAALLAAALALAAPAGAQSYAAQVRVQLDAAAEALREEGFGKTHDYEIDGLDVDEEDTFSVTLEADRAYAFVGACDADCSDIDFWLYDEAGDLLDADTSTDDVPIVRVTPGASGPFQIRVRMIECAVEPCYYGIGVFGD